MAPRHQYALMQTGFHRISHTAALGLVVLARTQVSHIPVFVCLVVCFYACAHVCVCVRIDACVCVPVRTPEIPVFACVFVCVCAYVVDVCHDQYVF